MRDVMGVAMSCRFTSLDVVGDVGWWVGLVGRMSVKVRQVASPAACSSHAGGTVPRVSTTRRAAQHSTAQDSPQRNTILGLDSAIGNLAPDEPHAIQGRSRAGIGV